jgi:hypothetical protein
MRRFDFGAFALFALFFVAFFWSALFSGRFFVTSDAFLYSYPLRTLAFQELRQGRLPLWTSQIMSGYPLLSMSHIGIGYPLTWFYLVLPGRFAEAIYDLAPYLLFPCFSYCYLREVGRSRVASVLAGLAFAYGGFLISPVAYNGMLGNALMWLPLTLIALERARSRPFIRCLLAATGSYSLAVLTGVGQGFLLSGLVALVYALFLAVVAKRLQQKSDSPTDAPPAGVEQPGIVSDSRMRWRPLAVMLGAVLFSASVAAFQILETMRAQQLSIRSRLTFDLFAFGSYRPLAAVKAFLLPLYHHLEASGFIVPGVLVLAVIAIVTAVKSSERDWRVFFWIGLAVCGFLFTLGEYTPVFALMYHVPIFNLFRGAGRHAFELTFAISILSAYGWDAASAALAHRTETLNDKWRRLSLFAALTSLLLMLAVGLLWFKDVASIPIGEMEVYYYPPSIGQTHYALWKAAIFLISMFGVWQTWKLRGPRRRVVISLALIAASCFFEPAIMAARWWWPTLKPASRFLVVSPTTQFLQKYPAEQNRIYTRVYPFIEEYVADPRLEPVNLTMLHGLQNVGGYEPLILERYSRALGNVYLDAYRPRPGFATDQTPLESGSHVLDLLNTRFLVSYPNLWPEPETLIRKEGVKFASRDFETNLKPGQSIALKGTAARADTLALVTATAFSGAEPDGAQVASVRVFSDDGKLTELPLRIGIDTAEWAHDRPGVRETVRHSLAPVFSGAPGDESKYTFLTRLRFAEPLKVDHFEIVNSSRDVVLIFNKATLFDSATGFSMPLPHYDLHKWTSVYDDGGAQILRNETALPRVWLVGEAESVTGEEALLRIRGQGKTFDPRRTALLEMPGEALPELPGGPIPAAAIAKLANYENNSIVVETAADTASVLVVSEMNYPGWQATLDGAPVPIHTADFLLRGIVLPAGSHRVEMRYTAPAARAGALISGCAILLIGGLAVFEMRRKMRRG